MSKKRNIVPRQSSLLFSDDEKNGGKIDNPPPRTSSAPSPEAYQRYQREKSASVSKPASPMPMSPVLPSSPRMSSRVPQKKDGLPADTPTPKARSIQALLKNLEQKSKPELLAIAKKMVSEINVKNRIISEGKQNEKWMMADLALSRDKPRAQKVASLDLQAKFQNAEVSNEDKDFLKMLMAFKVELTAAKKTVEEHEVSLIILEKKRTAAEEEVAYLKSITNPNNSNLDAAQSERIKELEGQLGETIQDFTVLQSKVSQWARASKRNQEGRISAEAIQKVLEEENANLKARLDAANASEATLRLQLESYSESLKESSGDKDAQFLSMLSTSQMQIEDLEKQLFECRSALEISERMHEKELTQFGAKRVTLTEELEALRLRNQELEEIVGSKNEYQEIIKKRASTQLMARHTPNSSFSAVSSKESAKRASNGNMVVSNSVVSRDTGNEREVRFLQEKVSGLEEEVANLIQTEKKLRQENDESLKKYQKLQQIVGDQEDLLASLKQAQDDNRTLQSAYDAALDKIQQKQISIEMLQKNMDKARERLEPYQKSMEELDDLQDRLAEERLEAQGYKDRIAELEADCTAQQAKILSLMERLENSDVGAPLDSDIVKDMQERINEYRHMNEMLSLQLEERTQDVELLETRLNDTSKQSNQFSLSQSQNAIATPEGFSLSQSTKKKALSDDGEDEEDPDMDYKKEFKKATATLAEQLITIQNLERVIAEDNQMVESLTLERTKLSQKLSLMQQIKGEYDNQTAEYEKLLARTKELEDRLAHTDGGEDIMQLQDQLDNQKIVIAQLQEALATMANQKAEIQKTMSSESVGDDVLKEQLAELKKQVHELQLENSRLTSSGAVDVLDTGEQNYIARIQQLETALTNFAEQKKQMLSQIQQYREMIEDLEEAQKSGHSAAKTLAQADAEMDFLQSEFDQKVQQIVVLEKKINVMEEEHAKEIHRIKSINSIEGSQGAKSDQTGTELHLSENQDELARLVSKLDATERELEEMRHKTLDHSREHENQLSLYKQEIESKSKEIERLHQELDLMEEKMTPFYDARSVSQSRRASDDLLTPTPKSDFPLKLANLENEMEILKSELQEKRNEIEDLQLRLNHAQEHISRLEAAAIDSYDSSEIRTKFESLVEEHRDLLADMKEMEAAHTAEIDALRGKAGDEVYSTDNIDTLKSQISDLERQLAISSEKENLEVERLTSSFQEQLEERQAEIEGLEATIESLTTQLNELEKSSMDIVAQQDSARSKIEKSYEESLQQKQNEIEKLKSSVEDAKDHIKNLEASSPTSPEGLLDSRILELEKSLRQKNEDFQSLSEELQTQIKLSTAKIEEVNGLHEQEVLALKQDIQELRDKNEELMKQCAELEYSFEGLKEQLEHHSGIAEDAMRQIDEYEDEILKLRERPDNEEQVELLKSKLATSEKELSLMKSKLANAGGESTDARVIELQSMNEQLMEKITSLSEKIAVADNNRMSINPAIMMQQVNKKELEDCQAQLQEAIAKINTFQQEKAELFDELDDLRDHNMVLQKALNDYKSS